MQSKGMLTGTRVACMIGLIALALATASASAQAADPPTPTCNEAVTAANGDVRRYNGVTMFTRLLHPFGAQNRVGAGTTIPLYEAVLTITFAPGTTPSLANINSEVTPAWGLSSGALRQAYVPSLDTGRPFARTQEPSIPMHEADVRSHTVIDGQRMIVTVGYMPVRSSFSFNAGSGVESAVLTAKREVVCSCSAGIEQTTTVTPTALDGFDLSTASTGQYEFLGGGLRMWTESDAGDGRVTGTRSVDIPLRDAGDLLALQYSGTGVPPGYRLMLDAGNGLVGELVYHSAADGDGLWTSTTNFGIGAGAGRASLGTLNDYLEVNPSARVTAFGFSLDGGAESDGVLDSVTFGCDKWSFRAAAIPVPDAPAVNDPCGEGNAEWVVPQDSASVDWTLRQDGHLIAEARSGYVLADGTTSRDYGVATDSGQPCPAAPAPPTPAPAPVVGASPPVVASAARLPTSARLRTSVGCVTKAYARAVVSGRNIRRVTYYVNGRKHRRLTRPNSGSRYVVRWRMRTLRYGTYKVRAVVVFRSGASRKSRTLTSQFSRCQPRRQIQPSFTG